VATYPNEWRRLTHLNTLLKKKETQTLLYVVDFSSSFARDFEATFFRLVFDARSPPFTPSLSLSLPALAAVA
jgi:hypothetical protein